MSVTDEGVMINGTLIPASQPFETDSMGRPLPRFRVSNHVLASSELLLMSDTNPRSFDARYFGPIPRGIIQSRIYPVLTW